MILDVEFEESTQELELEIEETTQEIDLEFGEIQVIHSDAAERYTGPYEITPGREEQILPAADKLMEQDVIVKAIPKEYGLVTYNQDKTLRIT